MKRTESRMSSTSDTPKGSPVTPLTLEYALALLQLKELPGGKDQEEFFLEAMQDLIVQNGEEWIRKNRGRLVEELKMLAEF